MQKLSQGRKFPTEDLWIQQNSYLFSIRTLHALGVAVVNWSACEGRLLELFGFVSKLSQQSAWIVTKGQGNNTLQEMLTRFAQANITNNEDLDAINYACRLFDACRVNRNHMVHFAISSNSHKFFMKSRSKTSPELRDLKHSVPVIRRNADKFRELQSYLLNLHSSLVTAHPSQFTAPLPASFLA